ncbi:MAG: hypothetical protein H0X03_04885 [Nitrosopumilus sp.]|nr:hypothetical protein [Nitrosopumilus sp.]
MYLNWNSLENGQLIQDIAYKIEENSAVDDNLKMSFESDFCSWYQPYHFLPRVNWGIHIRYYSLLSIGTRFYSKYPNLKSKPNDSARAAFYYLYLHEVFHYLVENSASIMEIITGKENIYKKYLSKVYSKLFNKSDCLEESLANCYLFDRCESYFIDKAFLKEELLRQSSGYNNFLTYDGLNLKKGIRKLVSQIRNTKPNPLSDLPIESTLDILTPIDRMHGHSIPIWIHERAKPLHKQDG